MLKRTAGACCSASMKKIFFCFEKMFVLQKKIFLKKMKLKIDVVLYSKKNSDDEFKIDFELFTLFTFGCV